MGIYFNPIPFEDLIDFEKSNFEVVYQPSDLSKSYAVRTHIVFNGFVRENYKLAQLDVTVYPTQDRPETMDHVMAAAIKDAVAFILSKPMPAHSFKRHSNTFRNMEDRNG